MLFVAETAFVSLLLLATGFWVHGPAARDLQFSDVVSNEGPLGCPQRKARCRYSYTSQCPAIWAPLGVCDFPDACTPKLLTLSKRVDCFFREPTKEAGASIIHIQSLCSQESISTESHLKQRSRMFGNPRNLALKAIFGHNKLGIRAFKFPGLRMFRAEHCDLFGFVLCSTVTSLGLCFAVSRACAIHAEVEHLRVRGRLLQSFPPKSLTRIPSSHCNAPRFVESLMSRVVVLCVVFWRPKHQAN